MAATGAVAISSEPRLMRLKASIWVSAYIRQLGTAAIPVMVVRRGDPDAGAIFIKINTLDGFAAVLRPALAMPGEGTGERMWSHGLKGGRAEEAEADRYLARQAEFDTDMWVIEVEDRAGRHYLDEFLAQE